MRRYNQNGKWPAACDADMTGVAGPRLHRAPTHAVDTVRVACGTHTNRMTHRRVAWGTHTKSNDPRRVASGRRYGPSDMRPVACGTRQTQSGGRRVPCAADKLRVAGGRRVCSRHERATTDGGGPARSKGEASLGTRNSGSRPRKLLRKRRACRPLVPSPRVRALCAERDARSASRTPRAPSSSAR